MPHIIGLDIGRGTAWACVLPDPIPIDFKQFVQRYKPVRAHADQAGIERIAGLGEIFALEPTGADHWIWVEQLRARNKLVLLVSGVRVRSEAKRRGLLNKSDREDAAVIAAYAATALAEGQSDAFLTIEDSQIRDCFRQLRSINRLKTRLINQLRARLSKELPERMSARAEERDWLHPTPPKLWRTLRDQSPETIGPGLSWYSRELVQLICQLETIEYQSECEAQAQLDRDCYRPYVDVFQRWGIAAKTQIALLSAIYPLENFLVQDGIAYEKVWAIDDDGTERQTGRNRSLSAFKRVLGCGKMRIQSGSKEIFVYTGDREIRAALYGWMDRRVVIGRQLQPLQIFKQFGKPSNWEQWDKGSQMEWLKAYQFKVRFKEALAAERPWNDPDWIARVLAYNPNITEPIARLQLLYEFHPNCLNLEKKKRILKVYPRFCKWLFYDLYRSLK